MQPLAIACLWAALIQCAGPIDPEHTRLIALLDDDGFQVRQEAHRILETAGKSAQPAIRAGLRSPVSLEQEHRLRQLDRLLWRPLAWDGDYPAIDSLPEGAIEDRRETISRYLSAALEEGVVSHGSNGTFPAYERACQLWAEDRRAALACLPTFLVDGMLTELLKQAADNYARKRWWLDDPAPRQAGN